MKPVRLPASATRTLPRWAIFALGMLYILPGLIGREPWKNDDAASFGRSAEVMVNPSYPFAATSLQICR